MEKSAELIAAEKALQDYFDSLHGEERDRALAYQARLESIANVTGGMTNAITIELRRVSVGLADQLVQALELGRETTAKIVINQAQYGAAP